MTIVIENIRNFDKMLPLVKDEYPNAEVVYCGRTMPQYHLVGGALANIAGRKERDAVKAVALFRQALWEDYKRKGPMYQEIARLARLDAQGRDIVLVCWCAPDPCHTEVIRNAIQYYEQTELKECQFA